MGIPPNKITELLTISCKPLTRPPDVTQGVWARSGGRQVIEATPLPDMPPTTNEVKRDLSPSEFHAGQRPATDAIRYRFHIARMPKRGCGEKPYSAKQFPIASTVVCAFMIVLKLKTQSPTCA